MSEFKELLISLNKLRNSTKFQHIEDVDYELDFVASRVRSLMKENELLREHLKEYKILGTDECPECLQDDNYYHHSGLDYNRTTIFYRPKEHDIHVFETGEKIKELRGE